MDQPYIQSVIKDREREVSKIVKTNQHYRYLRESITDERDSAEKGKNGLSLLWLSVINFLSGIFA
jgi:hypothetical protein